MGLGDMLPPAESFPFAATATAITGRVLLRGLTVRETSGTTPARLTVRDGGSGGGTLVVVTLAANESIRDWFTGAGLLVERDLTVILDSGAASGALWFTPESRFEGYSFPSEWLEGPQ